MTEKNSTRRRFIATAAGVSAFGLAGCLGSGATQTSTATDTSMADDSMNDGTPTDTSMNDGGMASWKVTIENVSDKNTLQTMDGSVAVPLSPGVYALHTGMAHIFSPGKKASKGLEKLAEDGKPGTLDMELGEAEGVTKHGVFNTPKGMDSAGPLKPGQKYTFEIGASMSEKPKLSIATMFVQSNDLFYAPKPTGIPLFDGDSAMNGDVTDKLHLWDAGTEVNQAPGEGGEQAPRQMEADSGEDEGGTVGKVDDEYDYPAVSDVIKVTLTSM